ncbi:MAG: methylenetetrahydrofolate reductase [NAD(P)H] [Paludibacteraceae bacterium]|nr:methylenetetrahydrofolate reductase [NAD(P)H] [Paludibacteraceae bacterium]
MKVIDLINNSKSAAFSFEILPPLKGNSIDMAYKTIDMLREFDPKYINITTHRSQMVYKTTENGLYQCVAERQRPGTVAVAAAIKNKYGINVVPHILCSGFTKEETEYVLIDLDFLGIHDLLLLRGDKARHDNSFKPTVGGYEHAVDLQVQVNRFNDGFFVDGSKQLQEKSEKFSYGVAGYPEKHDEAPNLDSDIYWLKKKVEGGADYVVTQMFFDNQKYYDFVNRCRAEGITIPIIPGLKPVISMNQLTVLPKIFHCDIPEDFAKELRKCKTDEEARAVGVEWCTMQARDLISMGVPSIHFYSLMAAKSVKEVAKNVY